MLFSVQCNKKEPRRTGIILAVSSRRQEKSSYSGRNCDNLHIKEPKGVKRKSVLKGASMSNGGGHFSNPFQDISTADGVLGGQKNWKRRESRPLSSNQYVKGGTPFGRREDLLASQENSKRSLSKLLGRGKRIHLEVRLREREGILVGKDLHEMIRTTSEEYMLRQGGLLAEQRDSGLSLHEGPAKVSKGFT